MFEANSDGRVPFLPRDAYLSPEQAAAHSIIPSLDMVIHKMDDPVSTGLQPDDNPDPYSPRDNWRPHPFNQFF
jgi:hypothetical protein